MTIAEDQTVSRTEFEALRSQIEELKAQIAGLKTALSEPKLSDDLMTVIAATIAAYLGKKATIKFVRRVSDESSVWQGFGRASISGSHSLPRVRGW